jgi:hypothetical protein
LPRKPRETYPIRSSVLLAPRAVVIVCRSGLGSIRHEVGVVEPGQAVVARQRHGITAVR